MKKQDYDNKPNEYQIGKENEQLIFKFNRCNCRDLMYAHKIFG